MHLLCVGVCVALAVLLLAICITTANASPLCTLTCKENTCLQSAGLTWHDTVVCMCSFTGAFSAVHAYLRHTWTQTSSVSSSYFLVSRMQALASVLQMDG